MSWGLVKAKGLGQKKVVVKTLSFGTGTTDNISATIYPGRGGLIVTMPELEKVDFAQVNVLSSLVQTSGITYATVASYSGRRFALNFASYLSGQTIFVPDNISGINISGVSQLQALVIGEGRKGAD